MKSQLSLLLVIAFVFIIFSVSAQAKPAFKVVKVESWDSLNMRSGPGVNNGVVGKLPHNAVGVNRLDGQQWVGKTHWVEVSWQGKRGWVSKAYLAQQAGAIPPAAGSQQATTEDLMVSATPTQSSPQSRPAVAVAAPPAAKEPETDIVKKKQKGMWILECGNASPFWKVEVLPEWMRGTLGEHKTGMPITHKRQEHGKYRNVAVETEVRGRNKWNRLRMTLNYTKSCYSTLTKKREAFKVKGMFNNETIAGCCRAYKVK